MARSTRAKLETPIPCECTGLTEGIKEINSKLDACYKIILEQNSKIDRLENEIKELKDKPAVSECIQPTYAEILRKQEHVLVVKPRHEKEVSKVKEDIRSNINPADLQVGLNIDRNTRNGGVILKCSDAEALDTIKNDIKTRMGEDYEIQVPKKLNPRLIIMGIAEDELKNDEDDKELTQKIIRQNRMPQEDNFKFQSIHKTKIRKGRFNLIVEVDPATFRYVINKEDQVLHVGWNNCKIYEHFSIRRCFKCGGYNHEVKDCKEKTACVLCAEEHTSNVCRNENKKCVNCVRVNQKLNLNLDVHHAAVDRECECYQKIVKSIKSKIAYKE